MLSIPILDLIHPDDIEKTPEMEEIERLMGELDQESERYKELDRKYKKLLKDYKDRRFEKFGIEWWLKIKLEKFICFDCPITGIYKTVDKHNPESNINAG